MPKVTIGKNKAQERAERFSEHFRMIVAGYEALRGYKRADTIKASGLSASGWYLIWRQPSTMRMETYFRICDFLKVPEDRRLYEIL